MVDGSFTPSNPVLITHQKTEFCLEFSVVSHGPEGLTIVSMFSF